MLTVLIWWLALMLMGIGFLPLTNCIFRRFKDKGWLFSKMLACFLSLWILWYLCVFTHLPFTQVTAAAVTLVLIAANYGVYFWRGRTFLIRELFPSGREQKRLVIIEEAMLLGLMLLAMYVIGFKPQAKGTEKFMDFAFMTAMNRSTVLPFEDTWFCGQSVNYYYGGQYAAAFLMKLTGTTPGLAYNAMRALITAMTFVLPFSLVFQLLADKTEEEAPEDREISERLPYIGGVLGGMAAAFAGNGHYLVYGLYRPLKAAIMGTSSSYWFPDSTRYIGYDPDLPDKTIHEFPSYSSILGDLHAHYINLIFVLLLLGIVYAWAKNHKDNPGKIPVISPEIILIGILTGAFRWTNAADFAIYFVVCGAILFFVDLWNYRTKISRFFLTIAGQAVVVFGIGVAAALPFTRYFEPFTNGYGMTHSHSLLYQLAILWGLPLAILLGFVISLVRERAGQRCCSVTPHTAQAVPDDPNRGEAETLPGDGALHEAAAVPDDPKCGEAEAVSGDPNCGACAPRRFSLPDVTVLLFGLCAAGLVLLPEIVYVKDIYGVEDYRANTMFKLTYQAFLLFAIMMAYVLIRAVIIEAGEIRLFFVRVGLVLLMLSVGYTFEGVKSWFGPVLNPSMRIGSDASCYIEQEYPTDAAPIQWLLENVHGSPVITEADGDSYSDFGRISVSTGLPTILGWYVHEWLWRNDFLPMSERRLELLTLYEAEDQAIAREILEKHQVEYIYIGTLEKEKYHKMNEELLRSLGEAVYDDGTTVIIHVDVSQE